MGRVRIGRADDSVRRMWEDELCDGWRIWGTAMWRAGWTDGEA